jgi:hypothetical protein
MKDSGCDHFKLPFMCGGCDLEFLHRCLNDYQAVALWKWNRNGSLQPDNFLQHLVTFERKNLSPLDVHPVQVLRLMLMDGFFHLGEKWAKPGPDGVVDMPKVSVLCGIERFLALTGNVPCELIMYVLTGHSGSYTTRGPDTDESWLLRNEAFDTMTPQEAREMARLERIRARTDPSSHVTYNALAIVAAQDGTVLNRMRAMMDESRQQRLQREMQVLGGDGANDGNGDRRQSSDNDHEEQVLMPRDGSVSSDMSMAG